MVSEQHRNFLTPACAPRRQAIRRSRFYRQRKSVQQRCSRTAVALLIAMAVVPTWAAAPSEAPNIVLVMADDQGWGETGYNGHPVLKTPHLDAMSENGLRFNQFYAAGPVCSPTRASVLTGRTHLRTGVNTHGYALRRQEKTLAQALQRQGYATGHFGKWHLNGLRGPGVPILAKDTHHPGMFGFDAWLSVTNFFDRDPLLSRKGHFEAFEGDSSEIVVNEALKFIKEQAKSNVPFLTVIWYGTPHSPFRASDADKAPFASLDRASQDHYGELVAMDRSIGTLRKGLRDLKIADNTLLWFCSDNGGLPKIKPETVGGLRGFKGSLYEGGLRVPGIIEWPGQIKPRVTDYPAGALDIVPTVAALTSLTAVDWIEPQDGLSLTAIFNADPPDGRRAKPLGFRCFRTTAWRDNDFKLIAKPHNRRIPQDGAGPGAQQRHFELYNLKDDPNERTNLVSKETATFRELQSAMMRWEASVERSIEGKDYAEGKLLPGDPSPRFWTEVEAYKPYFPEWKNRIEYASRLAPKKPKKTRKPKKKAAKKAEKAQ